MGKTEPLSSVDKLRQVARIAVEHGGETGLHFADAVEARLRSTDPAFTLDLALGLPSKRDQACEILKRARHALPRNIRTDLAAARAIAAAFKRYEASNFRRGPPPDPGSLRAMAHEFLTVWKTTPAVETIRKMLR